MATFDRQLQINYFSLCLRRLQAPYIKLDTNRLTLTHFCVHALDLLGVWENPDLQRAMGLNKDAIIDWIYSLQVPTKEGYETHVGFKGGTFLGGSFGYQPEPAEDQPWEFNHGHIAMTYTALYTLKALGDDLSRVDKQGILRALRQLQLEDGSYQCIAVGSEHDMRFLYCACCISHALNDWSGVDKDRAVAYIQSCRSFDGAISLLPGNEGHGGSTFCGIASLVLMERLNDVVDDEWRAELIRWCVGRQIGGLQGRPNKAEDTCYSYWIGGTLRLLDADHLLDHDKLREFVMKCQHRVGGFSKLINAFPDILHAYYSLAYLSLSQANIDIPAENTLKELNCTLGIAKETAQHFPPLFA